VGRARRLDPQTQLAKRDTSGQRSPNGARLRGQFRSPEDVRLAERIRGLWRAVIVTGFLGAAASNIAINPPGPIAGSVRTVSGLGRARRVLIGESHFQAWSMSVSSWLVGRVAGSPGDRDGTIRCAVDPSI
jgi:hypothetical protein